MDEHTSFGAWIQRRRRALDLTQAELAGCALGTIRKIETDDWHYPAAVRILDFPHATEYITAIGQSVGRQRQLAR